MCTPMKKPSKPLQKELAREPDSLNGVESLLRGK